MAKKAKPRDPYYFYGEDDFSYEQSLAREYYTFDNHFVVKLYRVDRVGTVQTGSRHHVGESRANKKKFLAPVELSARITAGKPTFKYIAGTSVTKQEYEDFSFNVFLADLEEFKINIQSGDFVLWSDGERPRFFEITKVTTLNSTNGGRGFKPTFMQIFAVLKSNSAIPDGLLN